MKTEELQRILGYLNIGLAIAHDSGVSIGHFGSGDFIQLGANGEWHAAAFDCTGGRAQLVNPMLSSAGMTGVECNGVELETNGTALRDGCASGNCEIAVEDGGAMSGTKRGLMLLVALVAMMTGCVSTAVAQVATTTVQDTVYSANGTPASGTVLVSWSSFTTAGGQTVPAGSTSATIGAGGQLTIALAPNAGATPMGSYYTAVFHLSDGTTSREYWVVPVTVPGGGPATLAAIKNQVLPISVAMQTVSKQYVDDAIAAAATGFPLDSSPYVQKTGDTMTGPLVLPADPVSPNQAADKNYVDENVAATAAGVGTEGQSIADSYSGGDSTERDKFQHRVETSASTTFSGAGHDRRNPRSHRPILR